MFSYLNFHTWENVTVSENRKNETNCSVAQPLRRLTKIPFKKLCHGRKRSKWMMNLYCPDYLTVMDYFSVYPIVRLSVSESIHKSVLFKLLNFWTVVRKALDGYSYFEKGCPKNVHATIPKGNMGYDQYRVPHTSTVQPTSFAFLQHSQTYIHGPSCHSFKVLWRTVN